MNTNRLSKTDINELNGLCENSVVGTRQATEASEEEKEVEEEEKEEKEEQE
jgi:hypothetical protein